MTVTVLNKKSKWPTEAVYRSVEGKKSKMSKIDVGSFEPEKAVRLWESKKQKRKPGFSKTINQNVGLLMCQKQCIKIIW